jgi:DNA-binding transcriptional regulator PaaX
MTPEQELEQARIRTLMVYASKSLRNSLRPFQCQTVDDQLIARITDITKQHVEQLIAQTMMHPKTEFEVVRDLDEKNGVILRFKTPTQDGEVNDDIFFQT